ncbi:hypothetical protein V9L20_15995 [Variovorax sp. CCNWLW225]|uniref:hypothetical protein n=1 Tax=Variovorax sp. CCNWLW225 TaxID=3127462 RepID=UPI0030780418
MTMYRSGSKRWSRNLASPTLYCSRTICIQRPSRSRWQQRFRRELDWQLGHDVVPALRAFQNASEAGESDLTKDEITLAKRRIKTFDVGRTAGFRDLGKPTKPISRFVPCEAGRSTCAGSFGRATGRTR